MMDFQNRVGHKTGSGAPASAQDLAADRRDRLRRLALETLDLSKDPYFSKNHVGQFECHLCLTVHSTESSYLSHTQGRKHQTNLARRAAKEQRDAFGAQIPSTISNKTAIKATQSIRIGRPGYRITKMYDPDMNQPALLFEIEFPEIEGKPRHRFMSAFEQKMEHPPDPNYQFLLFAAQPYETIAFKVPNMEIDNTTGRPFSHWDVKHKVYILQVHFKVTVHFTDRSKCAITPCRELSKITSELPLRYNSGYTNVWEVKGNFQQDERNQGIDPSPVRTAKPLPALPQRPSTFQHVSSKMQ